MVAVCDPIEVTRMQIESNLGLTTRAEHASLAGHIDAAVIATPTTLHHSVAMWCLNNGIHAFIEKPIASTVDEADELIRTADRNDLRLQVGHVERFNPIWTEVRSTLDPTQIQHIEARREGSYTGRSTDIGIVLDLMIHDIDLILSLVDSPVQSIRATGRCVLGDHEDFAIADLVFRNGVSAHVRASRLAANPARCMEIHCDSRWFDVDFASGTAHRTQPYPEVAGGQLRADQLPFQERLTVKDELFSRWLQQEALVPTPDNAIALEHTDFIHSIRHHKAPRVSGLDGARALLVCTEIADQIAEKTARRNGIIPAERFDAARRKAA